MKNIFTLFIILVCLISCEQSDKKSLRESNIDRAQKIVLENFKYISSGDMEAFKKTLSSDFKFTLSGTLKWNDGRPFSRTYEGFDSFMNDFLTPALATMPNGLIFHFDQVIANEFAAVVIWHGESEALYDTYNNRCVYLYHVNEQGKVTSITEYTDLLLSASSLLGQKINTNFKDKK